MFHIALLLLLAGHEWLLRPIGVSPVTSQEESSVTPVETDSDQDEFVTVKERDEIRTLFEIMAIHKFKLNKYYRADGTEDRNTVKYSPSYIERSLPKQTD